MLRSTGRNEGFPGVSRRQYRALPATVIGQLIHPFFFSSSFPEKALAQVVRRRFKGLATGHCRQLQDAPVNALGCIAGDSHMLHLVAPQRHQVPIERGSRRSLCATQFR